MPQEGARKSPIIFGAARATISLPKAPARSVESIGSVGGSATEGGRSGGISKGGFSVDGFSVIGVSVGATAGGQGGGHFLLPHTSSWAWADIAIKIKHSREEIGSA